MELFVGAAFGQFIQYPFLGGDDEFCRFTFLRVFYDAAGAADVVGQLTDFCAAFRMHENQSVGVFDLGHADVGYGKLAVNGTAPLPLHQGAVATGFS